MDTYISNLKAYIFQQKTLRQVINVEKLIVNIWIVIQQEDI